MTWYPRSEFRLPLLLPVQLLFIVLIRQFVRWQRWVCRRLGKISISTHNMAREQLIMQEIDALQSELSQLKDTRDAAEEASKNELEPNLRFMQEWVTASREETEFMLQQLGRPARTQSTHDTRRANGREIRRVANFSPRPSQPDHLNQVFMVDFVEATLRSLRVIERRLDILEQGRSQK